MVARDIARSDCGGATCREERFAACATTVGYRCVGRGGIRNDDVCSGRGAGVFSFHFVADALTGRDVLTGLGKGPDGAVAVGVDVLVLAQRDVARDDHDPVFYCVVSSIRVGRCATVQRGGKADGTDFGHTACRCRWCLHTVDDRDAFTGGKPVHTSRDTVCQIIKVVDHQLGGVDHTVAVCIPEQSAREVVQPCVVDRTFGDRNVTGVGDGVHHVDDTSAMSTNVSPGA